MTRDDYNPEDFDIFQQEAIRQALEKNIDITPYLNRSYHSACINEIAMGLKHHIDVTPYAKPEYSWRKMKELRLGIEQRLDISNYANPLYSYWQMREIRLGLAKGLDVSCYKSLMYTAKEMKKRRLWLLKHQKSHWAEENMTMICADDYEIRISRDGMQAYFNWHGNRPLMNAVELEYILRKHDITYGIDYQALTSIAQTYKTITDDTPKDQNTLIARGTHPVDGKDGYYVFQFHTKKCHISNLPEDGSIDFDHLNWYETVSKNQILAYYHPPTQASDGKTVTGRTIPAIRGKEKPILTGSGFELLPDQQTYIASKDGYVRLHKYHLTVSDLVTLDRLMPSDEPLYFNSDVQIKGTVTGPVTIHTTGDLVIDGFVDDAEIHCGGNLILKGGMNASAISNTQTANGQVISKFFEYVSLQADGNISFGFSLRSSLSSYGEIISYGTRGGIIGGTCYAEKGFCLSNLGNMVGVKTILSLGTNEQIRTRKMLVEKEITEIKAVITRLTQAYEDICKRHPDQIAIQNDPMIKLKDAICQKDRELSAALRNAEHLQKRHKRACASKIIVEHQIYDNVDIQHMDQKITAIPSKKVAILIDNNHLIMEKIS